MKRLKFLEKFKTSQEMSSGDTWVYHYRVHTVNDYPDRLLVEMTTCNHDGHMWRRWYCPTVSEYKGFRKTKKKQYIGLGGCAGLGYWFDKYFKKRSK